MNAFVNEENSQCTRSLWTTKQPLEAVRDTNKAIIIFLAPDVCLTPVGPSVVPVPYPVVDFCGHKQNYTSTVQFTGLKVMVAKSSTAHVHGDEPGTNKGIKSGTVGGCCEPMKRAASVRAQGAYVIRNLDRFFMNDSNTVGEVLFIGDMQIIVPVLDDDPASGTGSKHMSTGPHIVIAGVRVSNI